MFDPICPLQRASVVLLATVSPLSLSLSRSLSNGSLRRAPTLAPRAPSSGNYNVRHSHTYLQVEAHLAQVAAKSQRAQANGALVGRQALAAVSARITSAAVLRAFLCGGMEVWR